MVNYQETIDYLFKQLPMYQNIGKKAFKKDLTNIKNLCKHLSNPQNTFNSIHVAGTNGKGTTTHLIASILVAHGFKVGIYTSPHYIDFRERIKIGNTFIPKKEVIDFVRDNTEIIKSLKPSFFEITLSMAFNYFATENVDIAIIETGLGGRLDSTNIITPLISVITNISFDHQEILGNSLQQIAFEKSGIIKQNIPVVIGEKQEEVQNLFIEVSQLKNSKIYFADQSKKPYQNSDGQYILELDNDSLKLEHINANNPFFIKNLITSYKVIKLIEQNQHLGLQLEQQLVNKAISNISSLVYYIGRFQVISSNPLLLVDSAHNVAGFKILMAYLKKWDKNKFHLIIGFVKDKDIENILRLLPKSYNYYFVQAKIERAMDKEILQAMALDKGIVGKCYSTVNKAVAAAKSKSQTDDLIIVCGSIYVVSEVLK